MRIATATCVIAAFAAIWPVPLLAADAGPPALANNPFSRPSSEAIRIEQRTAETDSDSAPTLMLRATMVGRVNRFANVAGRILKPGDEYQGYRLVEIHERHAVFERGGMTTTIYVRPEQVEDDD